MTKRVLLASLISGALAAGSGCCGLQALLCRPFGQPVPICDPGPCDGPACGEVCTAPETAACGPACASCGEVGAGPCGDPCGPPCAPWGPLAWLFGIFTHGFCGDGCGELYWSDFHSEPPDCCDPCDRLGNFTGASSYQNTCASGQCWSGYLASQSSPSTDVPIAQSQKSPPERYLSGGSSSRYAPRVISVTDRVVSPATAEPTPVQQAAQPRRAPARQ